ncbi:MAG TPA: siderophore-interacting protein [Dehalococcoidia bacterium]|jgi:NADPH-dependent ferric siderophore reductase
MTTEQQPQAPRRVRPKPRMVEVRRVERPTPRCVRVTFGGEELAGYEMRGPASHIKVLFAREGEDRVALPGWGPEGPVLKEGQSMPPSRTYTPRAWNAAKRELTVEFMLHGEGLASAWARSAEPGDVMAVTLPGGPYAIDETADWYLIAGDESALPAIETILEGLPSGKASYVIVEVGDASEERQLAATSVTWLHQREDSEPGVALEQAVRDFEAPAGSGRIWVGCEADIMRSIRKHLLFERGMQRGEIHTHGYWKKGAANHPDHDVGQEI